MNNDKLSLLVNNIRENIKYIENGDAQRFRYITIEKDFKELSELLRIFLITNRDCYYGAILANIPIEVNFKVKNAVTIRIKDFGIIMEINPLLFCVKKVKEMLFLICHNIDHIVYNHVAKRAMLKQNKNSDLLKKFDISADTAVNDRIDREGEHSRWLSLLPDSWNSDMLSVVYGLDDVLPCESYLYYLELIKDIDIDDDDTGSSDESEDGDNSDNEDMSPDEENGTDKQNDGYDSDSQDSNIPGNIPDSSGTEASRQSSNGSSDNNSDSDSNTDESSSDSSSEHEWNDELNVENIEAATALLMKKSIDSMTEKQRGMLPSECYSLIERLSAPAQLSWQQILRMFIGTVPDSKRSTRTRLNRRQPERFDLSGKISDRILKIVIEIDTSGSVCDEDIAYVFNEIFTIISKQRYEMTVIECDCEIQKVYKVKHRCDVQTRILGRGGTAFSPVIEYVNSDKYYRDALLIYFTDGMAEEEIPKPLTYRNLWVIVGDKEDFTLSEPYGQVAVMKSVDYEYYD